MSGGLAFLRGLAIMSEPGPGEVREQSVVIDKTPGAGPVTARIDVGGSAFAVTGISAYQAIRREFTEEEILELPPYPPSIRENARRNGKIEYTEAAVGDGSIPVPVGARQPRHRGPRERRCGPRHGRSHRAAHHLGTGDRASNCSAVCPGRGQAGPDRP